MDFGGKLAFADICHTTHSFYFFFSREWRKAHVDRPNKQLRDTPWFPFISLFHLVKAPNQGLINGYNFGHVYMII